MDFIDFIHFPFEMKLTLKQVSLDIRPDFVHCIQFRWSFQILSRHKRRRSQILSYLRATQSQSNIMSVKSINDESHFQAELQAAGIKLVVVDFTATW